MSKPLHLFSATTWPQQQVLRQKCHHVSKTFVVFPKDAIEQAIPERFEQQVQHYPHRLAVKTMRDSLTYEELNRYANRVARAIVAQRGTSQEPVALLLESDAPLLAAILGALKAGKIYVPLDPSFPQARCSYILENSQAGLLLSNTAHYAEAVALAPSTCPVINLDTLASDLSEENLGVPLSPDRLCFILYTSGSTGQPKGVMQSHRNVLQIVRSYTNTIHICAEDRLSLASSWSVHPAMRNIFGALCNGAAFVPYDLSKGNSGSPGSERL